MQMARHHFLLSSLKAMDIFLLVIALCMSLWLQEVFHKDNWSMWELLQIKLKLINFIALLALLFLWHLVSISVNLYDSQRLYVGRGEWKDILKAVVVETTTLLVIVVIFRRSNVNADVILFFAVLSFLLTYFGRFVMRALLGWMYRHHRNMRNLLLVGWNNRTYDFLNRIISKPQLGYRIVGYIDDVPDGGGHRKAAPSLQHLGTLQDFAEVVDRGAIDEVVITLPIRSYYEQINHLIQACEIQGIKAHLLSDFFQLRIARVHADDLDGIPVLTLAAGTWALWPYTVKRAFDFAAAAVLLIFLSPVFLLIAILIKFLSPGGPVFFEQERIGHNRRRFRIYKFRTMVPDAERLQQQFEGLNEAHGPVFKIKYDPRITPIGRVLRKTSLDELPQLFNVMKGDMSLVGPRPLPVRDVARFEEPWLKRRFSVKPGLTCLWQVNGRSNTAFDEWIKQDLEYIDHWSLGLDFKILAMTIRAVLRGSGAY